jgi:hypothetical protein
MVAQIAAGQYVNETALEMDLQHEVVPPVPCSQAGARVIASKLVFPPGPIVFLIESRLAQQQGDVRAGNIN